MISVYRKITRMLLKREKPDIIFLCNPNNPTGITISQDLLEEILETWCHAGNIYGSR